MGDAHHLDSINLKLCTTTLVTWQLVVIPTVVRNEEAKKQTADPKQPCGRSRKSLIKEIKKENKNKVIVISSSDLNIELKESVSRRTRSRKVDWIGLTEWPYTTLYKIKGIPGFEQYIKIRKKFEQLPKIVNKV